MFRNIIDEKMKIIFKEQKAIVQMKIVKENEMHIESIKFNFIELIYLKKIDARVISFRLIYVVIYLIMNMFINDIKIKTLFDNNVEMNYMSKKLIDATQLLIRQEINIIIINFINKRVCFFNVCESIFINIKNIIISIFIFVIERLNHDFFLDFFFQRIARINVININNNSLKIILHSLNDEKRINFLKISAKHVNNKNKKFVFIFVTLNV